MTDPVKSNRGVPSFVVASVLLLVVAVIAVLAFHTFGPAPEPHPRYNTAELIRKGQRNPNSLTPDERRVYDHITHAGGGAPQAKAAQNAATKP